MLVFFFFLGVFVSYFFHGDALLIAVYLMGTVVGMYVEHEFQWPWEHHGEG